MIEAKLKRLRDREASVGAGEDEEDEEEGSRKRKRGGGGKAKGSKRAKGGAVVLGEQAIAALRGGAHVPITDLAKAGWVPGLGKGKMEHLKSAEGWTTCGALAQASRAEIEAWRAKGQPRGPAAVDFVVQLAAALKAAGEREGAGVTGAAAEEVEVEVEEVEEEEEEDEDDDEVDDEGDEADDGELDAGDPETESDSSDSDEEWDE